MTSSDTNSSGMMGGGPNACGVYEPSEHLELPNPARHWRGLPLAEIDVLRLDDGWRWATSSSLPNGSGHATPLTCHRHPLPSRDAAVKAAVDHLRHRMEGEGSTASRAIIAWINGLAPASAQQMDLFA